MNPVEKIRNELAKQVLCCFTCEYSQPYGNVGQMECSVNEDKPVKVKDNSVCANWQPDYCVHSSWEELLEAWEKRKKGDHR